MTGFIFRFLSLQTEWWTNWLWKTLGPGDKTIRNTEWTKNAPIGGKKKTTLYSKLMLWKFNKSKSLSEEKATKLSTLSTLCYKIYQGKTLQKRKKQTLSKYLAENKRSNQKFTNSKSLFFRGIQRQKIKHDNSWLDVRLWTRLDVFNRMNNILWQRRQGKRETLYTWGRGAQVETIKD